MEFELNYDAMHMLDAEELAEGGVLEAYQRLLPDLEGYVPNPDEVVENLDPDAPSYEVVHRGQTYPIYGPAVDAELDSWGIATFALFTIVNAQLAGTATRFYAINGGNDLGGMFLTLEQAEASRASLERKSDWPYIPTLEPPYFGMFWDSVEAP